MGSGGAVGRRRRLQVRNSSGPRDFHRPCPSFTLFLQDVSSQQNAWRIPTRKTDSAPLEKLGLSRVRHAFELR